MKDLEKTREKCFEDAQTGALRPRLCISVGYWSSYIFCTNHRLGKARKNERIFADSLYTISRSNQQNETSVEMKITKTCVTPVEQRECRARLWEWGTITLSAVALGRAHMTHLLERYCIKSADQLQLRALPTSAQSTCWEVNPKPQNQRWKSNLKYEKKGSLKTPTEWPKIGETPRIKNIQNCRWFATAFELSSPHIAISRSSTAEKSAPIPSHQQKSPKALMCSLPEMWKSESSPTYSGPHYFFIFFR